MISRQIKTPKVSTIRKTMIKLSMYQINEKSSHKIGEYTCKTFNNTEFISKKLKTHESIRKTHSREAGKRF